MEARKGPDDVAIDMLIAGCRSRWGYDLGGYARASLARRVDKACDDLGLDIWTLMRRAIEDRQVFDQLVATLSVTVTEMFRNPEVYRALRDKILPRLATYPFIKVWHAGCATGEEMYSMAILLDEAGLLDRSQLIGTDINEQSLAVAEEGIYPLERLSSYARLYRDAGGTGSFADYFHARYQLGRMDERLREKMTFYRHDLAVDEVFSECHLVMCRNVLIYFGRELQQRALDLFWRALVPGGFLCLGTREHLMESSGWSPVDRRLQLYRREHRE
jgi:chemotaxis protein methyltransferase CheR